MDIKVFESEEEMARVAADHAAQLLRERIAQNGRVRVVAATGSSQFKFLENLVAAPSIDWQHVELFHLDEYIGLSAEHPASFRRYLLERLIHPAGISSYYLLDGQRNPAQVCREAEEELRRSPVDVAFVGIGENGHLAFNDPPADFNTTDAYLVVKLDEACRRQQLGEGWFETLEDVPTHAISMSVSQILATEEILCIVPEARKAEAVSNCLDREAPSPEFPASALLKHRKTTVYLDAAAAAELLKE